MNQQIQNIQSAQNSLRAEMNNYDNQLMSLLTDMDILQSDMDTQEQEIEQANADLENAKAEEQQQYDAMKQRIQYMYENGDQSFLTALVGADSITDLLNRVEYVSDVYQYDRDMLTNYREVVQQVEDLTAQLESEMGGDGGSFQISYREQQSSLEQVIATKRSEMADFDSQLANAQSLASQYAQTIKQQNQIIATEKAKQAAAEAGEEKGGAGGCCGRNDRQHHRNGCLTAGTGTTSNTTGNTASTGRIPRLRAAVPPAALPQV